MGKGKKGKSFQGIAKEGGGGKKRKSGKESNEHFGNSEAKEFTRYWDPAGEAQAEREVEESLLKKR